MTTRREFLTQAALVSGGVGLFGKLPASIQKALAIDPQTGTTFLDAEHVVLLMQENRSFDHAFGTLQGVRGFNDPRAINLPNQNPVWLQSNAAGETYAPFHMDIKDTKATWMHSLPHSWTNQTDARNHGKFDQWLEAKKSGTPEYASIPMTMGYYSREDIPFYYALADAFTVCDQHFCSSLTGTTPNRLFFWTGTIREQQHENTYPNVWNENVDFGSEVSWPSFPERLEANGVSWKIYQNEITIPTGLTDEEDAWLTNFGDSPLQWFSQYNQRFHSNYISYINKQAEILPGKIREMEEKARSLPAKSKEALDVLSKLKEAILGLEMIREDQKKYTSANFENLSALEKNLHQKALSNNSQDPNYLELDTLKYHDEGVEREMRIPKGDIFHQFRQDVNSGTLPTVSWLVAPEHFSDHPSSAWYGAWYISETLEILTKNPELWKKTIFIVTYDENDGYFDHVPPFVAPDPRRAASGKTSAGVDASLDFATVEQQLLKKQYPSNEIREAPIGLGYRVPLIIASPWSRGGWVNSQVFDHTSSLQFLEKFLSHKLGKKLEEPNISSWRRAVSGDLSSAFRPYSGEKINPPAFLQKDEFLESIHKAQFKKIVSGYRALTADDIELAKKAPSSADWLPKQEKGIRPSNALPYELYADGQLSADQKNFEINFASEKNLFGDHAAGSPFYVYAPGKFIADSTMDENQKVYEPARSWNYAVAAGEKLTDSWPIAFFENGQYHLRVYGPNGFFREFKGKENDPWIETSVAYEAGAKKTGAITVTIINKDKNNHTIETRDNAYRSTAQSRVVKAGDTVVITLPTEKNHGWYDFSLLVKDQDDFEKRYAGRVETGKESYTDPFMGRVV